jgi:hypothetical protein
MNKSIISKRHPLKQGMPFCKVKFVLNLQLPIYNTHYMQLCYNNLEFWPFLLPH